MAQILFTSDPQSPWGTRAIFVEERKKKHRKANAPMLATAKPNPMFSDEQTVLMRFLIYKKPIACACCGKVRKRHWTMIVAFRAFDTKQPQYQLSIDVDSGPLLAPLTPVCGDHPLCPDGEVIGEIVVALRSFCQLTYRRLQREGAIQSKNQKAGQ